MLYVALVEGTWFDTKGAEPRIDWVPLVEGVMIGVEPRTNGLTGLAIKGVVLTIDWGSGGGPKVSKKSHNP